MQPDVKGVIGFQVQTNNIVDKTAEAAKKAGQKAQKQLNKADKKLTFGDKAKQNLDKLKIGIQNIGIGGDRLSKLGQLFKGGGWIAVAAAGVGLIAKGAMALWQKMTLSSEQAIARAERLRKNAQESLDQNYKDSDAATVYFDRLKQLNEEQQLSNLQKMQTIVIVNNLTKVYGDLGLSISSATGKVLGLNQAMERFAKINRDLQLKNAKQVFDNAKTSADTSFKDMFGNGMWSWLLGAKGGTLDLFGKGADNQIKKGLDAKLSMSGTKAKAVVSLGAVRTQYVPRELTEEQKKLRQGWNNGGIQGKINFLEDMYKKTTDGQQQKALEQLINKLKQLKKAQQQYQAIQRHGFKNDQEYLKHLQRQNKQLGTLRQSLKKQVEQFIRSKDARQQQQFYETLVPTSNKIAYTQYQMNSNQKNINLTSGRFDRQQSLVSVLDQEYKKAIQKHQQYINAIKKQKDAGVVLSDQQLRQQQGIIARNLADIDKAFASLTAETKKLLGIQKQLNGFKKLQIDLQQRLKKLKQQQADQDFKNIKSDEQKLKILRQQLALQKQIYESKNTKYNSVLGERNSIVEQMQPLQQQATAEIKNFSTHISALRKILMKYGLDGKFMGGGVDYDDLFKQLEKAQSTNNIGEYKKILKQILTYQAPTKKELNQFFSKMNNADFVSSMFHVRGIVSSRDKMLSISKNILSLADRFDGLNKPLSKAQQEKLKAYLKMLQIQSKIHDIQKRSADYYKNMRTQLDQQLAVQTLILAGKTQEAERLKMINSLKNQGLIIDQKQVDAILKLKKNLASLNVDKSIKQQGQSILDQLGANDKNYQIQKRIRQLEQANGVKLSSDQKSKVKTIVDVQFKMKNMDKLKPNFSDMQIKTNELTARGGFAGGAVAPNVDAVNKQIRDYQAKSVNTLIQIKQILQKGGVI